MKKSKSPLAVLPSKVRPYAVVVLALIPILAVWAVYDDVVSRQSAEIERLRALQAPNAATAPDAGAGSQIAPAPTPGSGSGAATPFASPPPTTWHTAVSA